MQHAQKKQVCEETGTTENKPQAEKNTGSINVDVPLPTTNFLELIKQACEETGKTSGAILKEMLYYKFSNHKLDDYEYFNYRLFDSGKYTSSEKLEFIGSRKNQTINSACNLNSKENAVLNDKIKFEKLLKGFGVPCANTIALFGGADEFPYLGDVRLMHSLDDMAAFFTDADYPLFGKPVSGSLSLGSVGIAGFDKAGQILTLTDNTTLELAQFHEKISETYFHSGYVFQEFVSMKTELKPYTGNAVGTFRVVTLPTKTGIAALYSVWKIPDLNSMADNVWRNDNLIALINTESGKIERCQLGRGLQARELHEHPGNAGPLMGLQIPDWEDVRQLAVNTASLFPGNRMIGFDIALSDNGPVVIEANTNPDHGLYQLASGRGLLHEDHRQLIDWNAQWARTERKNQREQKKSSEKALRNRLLSSRFKNLSTDVNSALQK